MPSLITLTLKNIASKTRLPKQLPTGMDCHPCLFRGGFGAPTAGQSADQARRIEVSANTADPANSENTMENNPHITPEELKSILALHKDWINGVEGGKRANLYGANLYKADLSGANLSWADLYKANLYGANLSRANLYMANLSMANLYGADLYGAKLSGANLSEANLYKADLYRADLSGADLYKVNLFGSQF